MNRGSVQPDPPSNRLADGPFDTLVLGGGIVGAGIARDAAIRGLRTALVEQNDFASGTSSRSSRLLHGGIRYLAQGRIGMVREASREKTIVHRIAPHLSEPLAFIFPTRKKTPWSRWKLRVGVKLYDLLCGQRNLGRSRSMDIRKTLALLPGLSTDGLTGSVRYYDGLTNDSRLVIDTLRSAVAHGASVVNYVRFDDTQWLDGVWQCQLHDCMTDRPITVQAHSIVNATGPWSDRIRLSETALRLTKGIHLVIDHSRMPLPDAVVMAEGDRILFAIPWGERVILGTTDTEYDGPLDSPVCNPEDIQYILDVTNRAFPEIGLTKTDILSGWAGLRPLVADKRGNPSDISRRHDIAMSHPGWWDVTGGKLTTYRLMAEETVDAILDHLGHAPTACQTADLPLMEDGISNVPSGILPPPIDRWVVEHCCQSEWAKHLDDVMIRRTSWRYYHKNHLDIAQRVADWMTESLGWDHVTRSAELQRYEKAINAAMP